MRSARWRLALSISVIMRATMVSRLSAFWFGPIWAAATLITRMAKVRLGEKSWGSALPSMRHPVLEAAHQAHRRPEQDEIDRPGEHDRRRVEGERAGHVGGVQH